MIKYECDVCGKQRERRKMFVLRSVMPPIAHDPVSGGPKEKEVCSDCISLLSSGVEYCDVCREKCLAANRCVLCGDRVCQSCCIDGECRLCREAGVPRVYVSNDFHGMFPVGTAAVVVASSEFEARKLLEEKITWTDDKSFSLKEISKVESAAHILHDGNY